MCRLWRRWEMDAVHVHAAGASYDVLLTKLVYQNIGVMRRPARLRYVPRVDDQVGRIA